MKPEDWSYCLIGKHTIYNCKYVIYYNVFFCADGDIKQWSPGQLIYYGRAELKQSDHRPVIAIIDIEIYQVDALLRNSVFYEVIKKLGPADSTIMVQGETEFEPDEHGQVYDDRLLNALLQELAHIGEVVLVRFIADTIWITFRDGQSAVNAAEKKSIQVIILIFSMNSTMTITISKVCRNSKSCIQNSW